MSVCGVLFSVLLVLFFSFSETHANNELALAEEREWVPVIEAEMMVGLELNETLMRGRRLTGSFRICALCTCCGSKSKGNGGYYCLPSPCCYAINCNIPNRPFGFCSFTPKTCNCFGCHL